jgi:hypothetical protein
VEKRNRSQKSLKFFSSVCIFSSTLFCNAFGAESSNRQKKVFYLAGQGGYSVNGEAAVVGGELGFAFKKKFEISLGGNYSFASPENLATDPEFLTASEEATSNTYSGYGLLRFYILDSFNVGLGGFYRSTTRYIDARMATKNFVFDEKSTSVGPMVVIGNKWVSKKGLTFAIDWLQYEFPTLVSSEIEGTTKLNSGSAISPDMVEKDKQDSLKGTEKTAERQGIHVGVVKLGWSF